MPQVKTRLRELGLRAESFNASLLYEPWEVKSKVGEPMKVFTPFWRAALALREPPAPLPAPSAVQAWHRQHPLPQKHRSSR